MPDDLRKISRQITWRITLFMVASNMIVLLAWLIGHEVLGLSFTYTIAGISAGLILLAWVFAASASEYALQPIATMWQAILHVGPSQSNVPAPELEKLQIGRETMTKLIGYVYDLASSGRIDIADSKSSMDSKGYFQTVVHNLSLPLIVLDANKNLQYANQSAAQYFRFDPDSSREKLIDDIIPMAFPSESTLEKWLKDCQDNVITDNHSWERVRFTPADAPLLQFDLAAHYSKRDSQGAETVLVFFDHTKTYEMDDRDISFVAMAVHELRTPLTIMRGYIEVFEDELAGKLNAEQKQFMHNMNASSQQLTSIVSNILNVARIEENQLFLQLKEESWRKVMDNAINDMSLRAKVHNKNLVVNIPDDLPTVAVDPVSIYEVIINLLDNAIKYSPGNARITITSTQKDDFIETTIEDQGIGIPENLIGHIFDKFYRSHRSNVQVGGTGLGLYLCKSIVSAHGGVIWVKSKEGKGTTIGFTIPTHASVADQIESGDNTSKEIVRHAHGWIKNHSMYRR